MNRYHEPMILSNYHTHSSFCDGKASLSEMATAAREAGISSLGFSAHGPVPLESAWNMDEKDMAAYASGVRSLSEPYRGEMDILLGYEADWIRDLRGPRSPFWQMAEKDYLIGSVHYLRGPDGELSTVDDEARIVAAFIEGSYRGDKQRFVLDYWRETKAMIKEGGFDILGHFDLVKKNNSAHGLFSEDEPWYRDAALDCLETLASSGIVAEINAGGIVRGKIKDCYPSAWLLEKARTLKIPFTLSADAHAPAHFAALPHAIAALKRAGYKECWYLKAGQWTPTALE
jgi:histidinol-phosphatase (PHP family)